MSKQVMTKDDGEATHDHNSSSSNNNDDDDDDDGNNGNNNSSEENKRRETRTATNDTDTTTKVACGLKGSAFLLHIHAPPSLQPSHTHPSIPLPCRFPPRTKFRGESERGRADEEDQKSTDVLCKGRNYGTWARTRLTQSTPREGKGLCHAK